MLRAIERATRQVIEPMNLPTVDAVNTLRIAKFKQRISETIAKGDADSYRPILEQLEIESGSSLIDIAAALACLSQGSTPLLLAGKDQPPPAHAPPERAPAERAREVHAPRKPLTKAAAAQMETFRIEVGSVHGIKPGNIVGAIANEAGIEGVHIGRVDIREDHSYVDLPEGMPKQIFKDLQKVRIAGRELRISHVSEKPPKPPRATLGRHPGSRTAERRPEVRKITARRRAKD